MKTTIIKGERYIVRESDVIHCCLKCAFKEKDCARIDCLTHDGTWYCYLKDTWYNRLRTLLHL